MNPLRKNEKKTAGFLHRPNKKKEIDEKNGNKKRRE
jgi:hypothetical protein